MLISILASALSGRISIYFGPDPIHSHNFLNPMD